MAISTINVGADPTGEGGDTLRAAMEKINANTQFLDVDLVAVSSARTLQASDANSVLVCTGTFTITVPDLGAGVQVGVINVGSGAVTIEPDSGVTMSPAEVVLDNADADVTTATLIATAAGEWAAVAGARPQTFTVVYDAGWPASRPDADHVLAVGHTSAPGWLTAADIWFEDVS